MPAPALPVLVVIDEPLIRELFADLLTNGAYEVSFAKDARTALVRTARVMSAVAEELGAARAARAVGRPAPPVIRGRGAHALAGPGRGA